MDINKIFNSFSPNDNLYEGYKNFQLEDINISEEELIDKVLKEHPILRLITFSMLLSQYELFKKMLYTNLTKKHEYDLEKLGDMVDLGKYLFFNNGWELIQDLDLNDKILIKDIKDKKKEIPNLEDNLIYSINISINYFLEKEEYEQCAHLDKIKNLIQTL